MDTNFVNFVGHKPWKFTSKDHYAFASDISFLWALYICVTIIHITFLLTRSLLQIFQPSIASYVAM